MDNHNHGSTEKAKRPRILISVDMEGVSGIVHPRETNPDGYDYGRARALMTAEANAAVAGVLDAEPGAEVWVADAHGSYRNLLPEEVDRRARLVRGKPRPLGMLGGIDERTDAVLFVGYHVRAGAGPGVLAHTMSDALLDVRVGGRSLGEIGLNAAMAGHLGVPVVLLSGDDAACAEVRELVPGVRTVAVKEALGQFAAAGLHPEEARERLRRAAAEAVAGRGEVRPFALSGPLAVEVDLAAAHTVDLAVLIPGVTRSEGARSARTVAFTAAGFDEAYRVVLLLVQLGSIRPA
ncbi:M55 family metallopeptidase [Streptomyces koyangensis]|uniref:Aminopeptidase n=1 Tax=Streptomyces koyangensis TaxID=188770 RepID=A0A385DF00_9ACTN|nr:M55 family metallopeptidase [Streptomyces koyangensis]AXQ56856.1 aminopeptidase [Streptomyces koyangensis]